MGKGLLTNTKLRNAAYKLIPQDKRRATLVNRNGNTEAIIKEMLLTDARAYQQTKNFAQVLVGPNIEATLLNCWNFTKHNIHYQVDELGVQLIKDPAAVWHTRTCDCKGYSLFIRSILKNLGIVSQFKFANYVLGGEFTHVYVIVPKKNGTYTTIDGCMPAFNVEKETVKYLLKP